MNSKSKEIRITKNRGITLIALVVTIVILIILATVSISVTFGEQGLIGKTKEAKQHYLNSEASEKDSINKLVEEYDSIEKNKVKFKKISSDSGYCIALDESGNIWTWESTYQRKLDKEIIENIGKPRKLEELRITFKEIAAGNRYGMALDVDGNIWTWGSNTYGQLGDGSKEDKSNPQKLENLGSTFKEIAASPTHSMALDVDGNIWTWGSNTYGQLGDGSEEDKSNPQMLENLGITFKKIAAGGSTYDGCSMAIDISGNVWTWGYNGMWQLGNGDESKEQESNPQKLENLGITFKEISIGNDISMALDIEGNIWDWGYNSYG